MNQFNNETLRYQDKVVCTIIPDDCTEIQEAIKIIIQALINLYGIIIAIFKKDVHYIVLHPQKDNNRLDLIRDFKTIESIKDTFEIIPFPKL